MIELARRICVTLLSAIRIVLTEIVSECVTNSEKSAEPNVGNRRELAESGIEKV